MNITKIETNFKRKLFWDTTLNIKTKKYSPKLENQIINIYPNITYQSIIGFGGAITEAAGYALNLVSEDIQNNIISDYFSTNGLNYNLCRLPIGSSDFSLNSYSYSSKHDLSDFSISRDKQYIISTIKKAQSKNSNIKFLSSPWSPPKFMKNTKMLCLGGKLLDKYKQTWADYLAKYILAYQNENISIEYITVQNEPNAIQLWESCIYDSKEESDFVVNYLFPTFQKNNITTKILIWDHNKEKLFNRSIEELNSEQALNSISGIAFHYYTGDHFENITLTHDMFPNMLIFHTEGCTGYSHFNQNDEVHNGELYGHEIIGDLNAGINGYTDWNIILDNQGGPNHKKNYCNSPIMINENNNGYIKNLTYYYIGHFSKYINRDAKRIAFSKYTSDIEMTAFKNSDNSITIVLMNRTNTNREYNLCINDNVIHDNLDSHAIVTYIIN